MAERRHDYGYREAGLGWAHSYLLPKVVELLNGSRIGSAPIRVFELGCGNGSVANALHQLGFQMQGIDYSESGIRVARENYPHLKLNVGWGLCLRINSHKRNREK